MYAYRSMVRVHENIYEVKRIFFQSTVKDVSAVKEWLKCTDVFHRDGLLYFCQIIEDVEFTEEVTDSEPRPIITQMNCTVIETIYPEQVIEEDSKVEEIETKQTEDNG